MRRSFAFVLVGAVLLFGGASDGRAQVRRVKMKIDGYLCGN